MRKIKLSDINDTPCRKYLHYICDTYGADGKFDPIEVFKNVPGGAFCNDVIWLMDKCEAVRNKAMFKYAVESLSCDSNYYCTLLEFCWDAFPKKDDAKIIKNLKGMEPRDEDLSWLIYACERAQTDEMLQFYMSLTPCESEKYWLIDNCEFARDSGIITFE